MVDMAENAINDAQLEELVDVLGPERVLAGIDELTGFVEILINTATADAPVTDELRRLAHKVAGLSANLGFTGMSAFCVGLEHGDAPTITATGAGQLAVLAAGITLQRAVLSRASKAR